MATKRIDARVQNKRDTEANWLSENPVLLDGELIFVDLTSGGVGKKVGDGVSAYADLPMELVVTAEEKAAWNALSSKQDKLTGTQGQVVGFDENGDAVAQDSSVFVVTAILDGHFDIIESISATYTDIVSALQEGKAVIVKGNNGAWTTGVSLYYTSQGDPDYQGVKFTGFVEMGGTHLLTLTFYADKGPEMFVNELATQEDVSVKQNSITGTPNDFVVIGADGNVTTKTIANAEEASF